MGKFVVATVLLCGMFIMSCAEMLIFGAGAGAGYYIGKEGYKVRVEKEE